MVKQKDEEAQGDIRYPHVLDSDSSLTLGGIAIKVLIVFIANITGAIMATYVRQPINFEVKNDNNQSTFRQ
jgi:hypothetical protein